MQKSVLISIQPKWCEMIASGRKIFEVRKTKPNIPTPFKCYIYETKGQYVKNVKGACTTYGYGCGKVIGEFVCDTIITDRTFGHDQLFNVMSCMNDIEAVSYCDKNEMYGWHISDLKIYDKPKGISEFCVIDKDKLKECPYRERICQNPEFTNGNYLWGGYSCSKTKEPEFDDIDFCRGGCADVFKPLTRPPQSWCYVESLED